MIKCLVRNCNDMAENKVRLFVDEYPVCSKHYEQVRMINAAASATMAAISFQVWEDVRNIDTAPKKRGKP